MARHVAQLGTLNHLALQIPSEPSIDWPEYLLKIRMENGRSNAAYFLARKILQKVTAHLHANKAWIGKQGYCLPPYSRSAIVVKDGTLCLDLGHVPNSDLRIAFRSDGAAEFQKHIREESSMDNAIKWVENHTKRKAQPFNWSPTLFKGLFEDPIRPESKAVLQYYFVQWAVDHPERVLQVKNKDFFRLEVEDFRVAFIVLRKTERFKEYQITIGRKSEGKEGGNGKSSQSSSSSSSSSSLPPSGNLRKSERKTRDSAGRSKSSKSSSSPLSSPPPSDDVQDARKVNLGEDGAQDRDDGAAPGTSAILRSLDKHIKDPGLSTLYAIRSQIHVEETLRPNNSNLPFRILLGSSLNERDADSRVWMYFDVSKPKSDNPRIRQPCRIETTDSHGVTASKRFTRTLNDARVKYDVDLVEPFRSLKCEGRLTTPIYVAARYFCLLACRMRGVDVEDKCVPVVGPDGRPVAETRYLNRAARAYVEAQREGRTTPPPAPATTVQSLAQDPRRRRGHCAGAVRVCPEPKRASGRHISPKKEDHFAAAASHVRDHGTLSDGFENYSSLGKRADSVMSGLLAIPVVPPSLMVSPVFIGSSADQVFPSFTATTHVQDGHTDPSVRHDVGEHGGEGQAQAQTQGQENPLERAAADAHPTPNPDGQVHASFEQPARGQGNSSQQLAAGEQFPNDASGRTIPIPQVYSDPLLERTPLDAAAHAQPGNDTLHYPRHPSVCPGVMDLRTRINFLENTVLTMRDMLMEAQREQRRFRLQMDAEMQVLREERARFERFRDARRTLAVEAWGGVSVEEEGGEGEGDEGDEFEEEDMV